MRKALSLAVTQVLVLLYSLALTFIPDLYWLVVTLFFVTYMAVAIGTSYRRMRSSISSEGAQMVRSGRQILRMDQARVMELLQKDSYIGSEIREQAKYSVMPFLSLPAVFGIYYLYLWYISPMYHSAGSLEIVLLGNIAMFELLFLVPSLINVAIMRGRTVRMVQPVASYLITDRGIQGPGILVKFPVEDGLEVRCSRSRRFIEIVREQSQPSLIGPSPRMLLIQRLYMDHKDLDRALEVLRRQGKKEIQCSS